MEKHAHIAEALKPEEDLQRPTDSPLHHDAMARRPTSDSPHHRYGDRPNPIDPLRKVSRTSGGYDRSVEQSPLHPRNQARVSLEQKGSLEGGHGVAPNTPGRFKIRTGDQGDESPDKGPVVPRFGEWDENNPSSADNFTHIFNKVREEKQTGTAKVPISPSNSRYLNSYNQDGSYKSSSCCCFRWCKK